MLDKLQGVEERFIKIEQLLSDPVVVKDQVAYQKYVKEHAELNKIMAIYFPYKEVLENLNGSKELLNDPDPDIKEMAKEEIVRLTEDKERLEEEIKKALIPKDPMDEKNVIVEIRAGTGGEEAALFVGDIGCGSLNGNSGRSSANCLGNRHRR